MIRTREDYHRTLTRLGLVLFGLIGLMALVWLFDDGKPPMTHEQRVAYQIAQEIEIMRLVGVAAGKAFCPEPKLPEEPRHVQD